jgi:hypothetical protein
MTEVVTSAVDSNSAHALPAVTRAFNGLVKRESTMPRPNRQQHTQNLDFCGCRQVAFAIAYGTGAMGLSRSMMLAGVLVGPPPKGWLRAT